MTAAVTQTQVIYVQEIQGFVALAPLSRYFGFFGVISGFEEYPETVNTKRTTAKSFQLSLPLRLQLVWNLSGSAT